MSMAWGKMLGATAPKQSIKYLLHRHLTGWSPGRPLKNIHASELTKGEGLCPRLYALSDLLQSKVKDEYLTTSQEVTYHMGRVLQDSFVHWLADLDIAIGNWRCALKQCKHLHEFQKRPAACIKCGCPQMKYEEMRFVSEECGASCGIDTFVQLGGPKLQGVEVKTMDKDEFKALKAPLAEHRLRSNLYCRIMDDSLDQRKTLVDTQSVVTFYISKGGFGVEDPQLKVWGLNEKYSPFKEFVAKRNDADTEYLWQRAKVVHDHRKGLVGMPTGLCTTAMSKRATYCICKAPCFSGQYPATFDWQQAAAS